MYSLCWTISFLSLIHIFKENTGKKIANMQTEKYKARQAAYRAFITATVPEKG